MDHCDKFVDLQKEQVTSVKLMHVLKQKKAPMNAYQEALEWHLKETGALMECEGLKDTTDYNSRQTLMKEMVNQCNGEGLFPIEKKVRLPS